MLLNGTHFEINFESVFLRHNQILPNSLDFQGDSSIGLLFNSLSQWSIINVQNRYWTWVIISGTYPTTEEFIFFTSDLQVSGPKIAIQKLLFERISNIEYRSSLENNYFRIKPLRFAIDVTHTSKAPYLTGIQRVVRELTSNLEGRKAILVSFVDYTGQIIETNFLAKFGENGKVGKNFKIIKSKSHLYLINIFLKKIKIQSLVLKVFRFVRNKLKLRIHKFKLKNPNNNSKSLYELSIIPGVVFLIPEIPIYDNHLSILRCMSNFAGIEINSIFYDFVPLFHSWSVHQGNKARYLIYLSMLFSSSKIFAISSLVREQIELVMAAFRLERTEYSSKPLEILSLDLPPGVKPAAENEFTKDPDLIVMLGSLEPRKNHTQFFDALEILNNKGIEFKAKIIGSAGWNNEQLLKRIFQLQTMGIDLERITKADDDKIRETVGSAQVLVQVSEAEGFGLPVVEALALGTRVIVSNIRPLVDIKNKDISIVELGDSNGLARMLEEHLANPELISKCKYQGPSWKDWQDLLFKENLRHNE